MICHKTMLTHASVIVFGHRIRGLASPADAFCIKKQLLGIKWSSKAVAEEWCPFLLLTKVVLGAPQIVVNGWALALFQAVAVAMFAGGFKVGEVLDSGANLHIQHGMILYIRSMIRVCWSRMSEMDS